ncbi:DJ-1/PfpI family protein [Streptomyces sp. URMC 123]|uniref:DJ-1/PfpI family protein n=1 Tax=Streptomyces sp. URMC 123 TaxID=3423403 RepID=UPI003F199FF6
MHRRTVLRSGLAATTGLGLAAAASPATAAAAATGAAPAAAPRPLRVHTVLYDGVEEQDFAGPIEVFGILAHQPGVEQRFVTVDGPRTVITSAGMAIDIRHRWSPRSADLIVVPGGGYGKGAGVDDEIRRGVLPRALADARRPGLILAAVCTGAMLLSAAGITKGRPCTTHHVAKKDLAAQGGKVVDGRVVDDGDLVTSGGVTSGIDLALWLCERLYGPESALFAEKVLEYERRGTVWRSA